MLNPSLEYKIISYSLGETKAGKKMARVQILECQSKENYDCVIWQEVLDNINKKVLKPGNIISITDSHYNDGYKSCTLTKIKLIKESSGGLTESEREILFNKIIYIIDNFSNEELKLAILEIINNNKSLFKVSPAAKIMHHNYIGGLMQHIWECIALAKANFPVLFQDVDHELILAGCITHDLGKIFEYKIDLETGLIDYNEKFKKDWISHTQYGFSWAMNNGFNDLARIIAAHHSRTEWGSLIDLGEKDLESALYLLHHIDDMSAKFGAISVDHLEKLAQLTK